MSTGTATPVSRIYEGWVTHARRVPRAHRFRLPLYMLYLDLSEIPDVLDPHWGWSARRPAIAWFRRRDYLGDPEVPLIDSVRDLVRERTGRVWRGPVAMLTHLRYFGYCFNPVTFYYVFDVHGGLRCVVAEITNTPWGERYSYVLEKQPGPALTLDDARVRVGSVPSRLEAASDKVFHVSPFMPMRQRYQWMFSVPTSRLAVRVRNLEGAQAASGAAAPGAAGTEGGTDHAVFVASLDMRSRPLTTTNLNRVLVRYPMMTGQVIGSIYWQAFRLWKKGIPVHAHPRHAQSRFSQS